MPTWETTDQKNTLMYQGWKLFCGANHNMQIILEKHTVTLAGHGKKKKDPWCSEGLA